MELSYELRPGARSRPGPPELWERFDQAVRALGDAYEGISLAEIARAFGALARIAHEIADELEQRPRPPLGHGARRERPGRRTRPVARGAAAGAEAVGCQAV